MTADFAGRPTHCTERVVVEGRTRLAGRNGRVLTVWSCDGHREGLVRAKQL
jgi:hypothetical protein